MPKVIPNLRERILENARAILLEEGYQALSMRRLARSCQVAAGTLYNYFSDKDELVALITLEDWQDVIAQMEEVARQDHALAEGLTSLCELLEGFTGRYRSTWEQYGATGRVSSYVARFHQALRAQLSAPIRATLCRAGREDLAPLADVLAETLLACSVNEDLGASRFGTLASALDASHPNGHAHDKERA